MSYLVRSLKRSLKKETKISKLIDDVDYYLHNNTLYSFYCKLKCFLINLKWMIPAAWKFRWWDSHFNVDLFCKSLEITGHNIIKYGNSTVSVKEGRRAIFAAHKLRKSYEYSWTDDKSAMYLFKENPITLKNNKLHHEYKQSKEFYNKLYKVMRNRVEKIQAQNKKEAWDYIYKYIDHWWD